MEQIRCVLYHQLTDVVIYGEVRSGGFSINRVLVGTVARSDIAEKRSDGTVTRESHRAVGLVRSYLDGNQVDFAELSLAPVRQTPFVSAVVRAARSIGFGHTCPYSALARNAGYPGAIRAAASVMRNNRWPLIVPCHRVIRKDGSIGAYNGDREGDDAALKKKLLQMEQVRLNTTSGVVFRSQETEVRISKIY